MLDEKSSFIFLAHNRTESLNDGVLIKKHSIVFGLEEIELEEVFLEPPKTLFFKNKSTVSLTYIGDTVDENENLVKENTFLNGVSSLLNPYLTECVAFFSFFSLHQNIEIQQSFCVNIDKLEENSFSEPSEFTKNCKIRIGKFLGKTEMILNEKGSFLAFIIEGAFEIEGCLLEKGDALRLENFEDVALESLSGNGLVVVFSKLEN